MGPYKPMQRDEESKNVMHLDAAAQLEFDEDVTQVDGEDYIVVNRDPLEASDSGTKLRCGSRHNRHTC